MPRRGAVPLVIKNAQGATRITWVLAEDVEASGARCWSSPDEDAARQAVLDVMNLEATGLDFAGYDAVRHRIAGTAKSEKQPERRRSP